MREISQPLAEGMDFVFEDVGNSDDKLKDRIKSRIGEEDVIAGIVLHFHGSGPRAISVHNRRGILSSFSRDIGVETTAGILMNALPLERLSKDLSVHLWVCEAGGNTWTGSNFQDGLIRSLYNRIRAAGYIANSIQSLAFTHPTGIAVHSSAAMAASSAACGCLR